VRLYFKIFLKVVSAHLVVETQLVVELLRIVLVVFPQFGSILSRHGFDILPFGLQVLHLVITLVGVVGSGREFLDAFNNLLLAFQVGQFFLLLFLGSLVAEFANERQLSLEVLLLSVGSRHKVLRLTTFFNKFVAGSNHIGIMNAVVKHLQVVKFSALHITAIIYNILQAINHLGLCGRFVTLFRSSSVCCYFG